ncbi:MAG: hypothetical protein ACK4NW_10725 [Roseinatronobacter sp.]
MRLVLNIGMHKTGSSAIQQSLHGFERNGVSYFNIGLPNHSAIFATMFMPNPESYGAHRKNTRSLEDVHELRDKFFRRSAKLRRKLDGFHTVIGSAEDLVLMDVPTLIALRDWAENNFDDIALVGYVRPPLSFMTSSLQQRVAGGVGWSFRKLYPHYRDKFEKFDTIFGRERVTLVKFDRATLHAGDVVLDFARRAGVDLRPEDVISANESRSLETTAALNAQRVLGRGWLNYPGSPRDNNALVTALRALGTGKIVLHPETMAAVVARHKDDLDWMAARLGVDFVDTPSADAAHDPNAIRTEEDFLTIASGQLPQILDLIRAEAGDRQVDPQIVANAVDMLLDLIRTRPKA